MFKKLHQFLEMTASRLLLEHNDDLVGFFNSVPQSRIILAVEQLLEEFSVKFPSPLPKERQCFTVYLGKVQSESARVFQGFTTRTKQVNARVIYLSDIPGLVQLSFDLGIFQALNLLWTQICGTSIGNQVSPVLSNIAVSLLEINWMRGYKILIDASASTWFMCRYVDNRLSLTTASMAKNPAVLKFHQELFYEHPVCLELVDDHKFLGFVIDVDARSLTYILPSKPWQIRPPQSAGSISLNLSGLRSRVSLIKKYSFPSSIIPVTLGKLRALYASQGFDPQLLQRIIR